MIYITFHKAVVVSGGREVCLGHMLVGPPMVKLVVHQLGQKVVQQLFYSVIQLGGPPGSPSGGLPIHPKSGPQSGPSGSPFVGPPEVHEHQLLIYFSCHKVLVVSTGSW